MNIAVALKSEIARVARKELKGESQAQKKASAQYRSDIAALKKRVAELERQTRVLIKATRKATVQVAAEPAESALRFNSKGFAALRAKLGLSANELGAVMGVSGQSVYKWEQGKAKPRAAQLAAIAKVRKMGKREAAAALAAIG